MNNIDIDLLIDQIGHYILIDVRSPNEFQKGNIPGSINIPLLNNEERKEIGTIYKQENKRKAIKRGLEFFGPKMKSIVEEIDQISNSIDLSIPTKGKIAVYCWRGGMRSNIFAWLISMYGYDVVVLRGGYKSYRNWCLNQFTKKRNYVLIGGYTGSGKTKLLNSIFAKKNIPFIDLEKIAIHKGSAFGGIGLENQPSQEHFENSLAFSLNKLEREFNYIVFEDESQRIGTVSIPQTLWEEMCSSKMIFLQVDFFTRLKNIILEYGPLDRSLLAAAILRLQKKLGGLETKLCLEHLLNKDYESCFTILLRYYDKLYMKSFDQKRSKLEKIEEIQIQSSSQDDITSIYNTIRNATWTLS